MGSYLLPRARLVTVCGFEPGLVDKNAIVLVHIDLSRPGHLLDGLGSRLDEVSRHSSVVNRFAHDITKRRLHEVQRSLDLPCLSFDWEDCSPDDLVIVKTDLNYGGQPERLAREQGATIAYSNAMLHGEIGPENYWVGRFRDVPLHLRGDHRLVIERFLGNSLDAFIRVYRVCGRLAVVVAFSPFSIKKVIGNENDFNYMLDVDDLEDELEGCPLPPGHIRSILKLGDAMGLDYFGADVVFSDAGEWAVVDINATPWAGKRPPRTELLEFLRFGLEGPTAAGKGASRP